MKAQSIKIPFGLKDGKLVEIDDVEQGAGCNCLCPACGKKLIAKKGKVNIHHFSHYDDDEGKKCLQTILHLAAKDILMKAGRIWLPAYSVKREKTRVRLIKEREIVFDKIYLEKKIDTIVPDIIIEIQGKKLLAEVAVTSYIDREKWFKIRRLNISAIEISLGSLYKKLREKNQPLSFALLEEEVINNYMNRYWINNEKVRQFYIDWKRNSTPKPILKLDYNFPEWEGTMHYVNDCPLKMQQWKGGTNKGRYYAKIDYGCDRCSYNLNRQDGYDSDHIYCGWMEREKFTELIKKHKK